MREQDWCTKEAKEKLWEPRLRVRCVFPRMIRLQANFIDLSSTSPLFYRNENVLLRLGPGPTPDHFFSYIPRGQGEWLLVLFSSCHTLNLLFLWLAVTMATSPSSLL